MSSFNAPHNGLRDSRELAHPDDHSDENTNFNNSVSINGGAAQNASHAKFYTDSPYATVVSAIELGPNDIPKGKKNQQAYNNDRSLYNTINSSPNMCIYIIFI